MGYSPWGQKELDTTEQLMLSLFHGRKYSISQKNYEIAKFPGGSDGKEFASNVRDPGSISGWGRSPGEGNGYALQYSGLENSMDCIVHGVTKNWTLLSDFQIHRTIESMEHSRPEYWSG